MSTVADRREGAIRTRHRIATPTAPFQPELEKGQPGGYAALADVSGLVPTTQLATGAAAAGKALLGDQTWGDVATQVELDAEATTRATADTTEATARANADTTESNARVTHQNLTTTAHGGIVASTDARLSDSRAPNGAAGGDLSGTYPNPAVAALAITDAKVAAANKDGAAGTASMRTLGTGAAQSCAGNDSRLSDARTPTSHKASHQGPGSDYPLPTRQYVTKTGNYTVTNADDLIRVGLSPTITLFDPSTATDGKVVTIANVGAGTVTVANAFGGYSGTIAAGLAVTVMASLFSGTYLWDRIA